MADSRVELVIRTEVKPWFAEVHVDGKPLLDGTGDVLTLSKAEVYGMSYGDTNWVHNLQVSLTKGLKDITPP